jgi:RNA polymerase sigma factor (sigma-70 family)
MALPNAVNEKRSRRRRQGHKQLKQQSGDTDNQLTERELVRRYRTDGDSAAKDELIERLMPLAHNLARHYQRPNTSREDLVQVAASGLIKAVDRFDPDCGTALSSYAVPPILEELKSYFRGTTWSLHAPRDMQGRALHVNQATSSLSSELGRSPTPAEVATEVGDSTENVLEAMEAASAYDSVSVESSSEQEKGRSEPFASQVDSDMTQTGLAHERLSSDFELTQDAPAKARAWLDALEDALDGELFFDLRVLVSELVANSVRHSGRTTGAITVTVRTNQPQQAAVEVIDPGSGFGSTVPGANQIGLGLYVLDRLVDRWGVDDGDPTRVWFEIDRST